MTKTKETEVLCKCGNLINIDETIQKAKQEQIDEIIQIIKDEATNTVWLTDTQTMVDRLLEFKEKT